MVLHALPVIGVPLLKLRHFYRMRFIKLRHFYRMRFFKLSHFRRMGLIKLRLFFLKEFNIFLPFHGNVIRRIKSSLPPTGTENDPRTYKGGDATNDGQ